MKVLHVLPFPGVGGTEIATRRIADATRAAGIEHGALLLAPTDDQVAYLREAGIPCRIAAPRPEPSLRHGLRFLRESRALAAVCREADLIHCADIPAAYYAAVAGRLAGRPVLTHVRNRHDRLPRRDRIFVRASTHYAFVSRSTRAQLPIRVPDARASVVYDGIDVPPAAELAARPAVAAEFRAELGLPADTPIAAMFARVNPQKDYPTLIAAAARLKPTHPQLRFVIVGDHAQIELNRRHHAEMLGRIEAAGVARMFVFTGFRSDARRIMLASDLCVLSTHFEGMPLVLIEAMSIGRPQVATAVDGIPETLTDGATGFLHAHQDAEGLADAIARLLADPESAERMGQAAREEAVRRFSAERFAQDMIALYRRLAGPRPAALRRVATAHA